MSAAPIEAEKVVMLPVDQCHKSASQPRRRGGDKPPADDFVASIREKGVIQPIIVRVRKAGGWDIVFGHRRHTGSAIAKRETIPAIVRDLTDDDVFEQQLIENIHREDMHPLDEADGFKRMLDRGKTSQYIAAKIGRPLAYVAQRMKLCELGKEARAALDKEEISLGVAVLLARIPAALQADAFRSISHWWGVAEAKRELERRFLLRLDQAAFDIADPMLVEKAGACVACPKRTGQQRELFPDAARADLCTDPVCYRGKMDALWKIRRKEAQKSGQAVLEGAAAEKATNYRGTHRKLDDREYVGGSGDGYKTVRQLLGKELPPVTLAREKDGTIVELVPRAAVEKAIRRNKPKRAATGGTDSFAAQRKREAEKEATRTAALEIAIGTAIERVDRITDAKMIRFLTQALIETSGYDCETQIAKRRNLDVGKKRFDLEAHLETLATPEQVAGLALEVMLWTNAPNRWRKRGESVWADAVKTLGIDFATIEKKVAAEAKAKKKTKKGGK